MLVGLLLSMIAVFLVEMLDNKVKDAEFIAKQFQLPVLGEIPYFVNDSKKDEPDFKKA